jgi:uncharacterized RDD family membrane protein YckC
MSTTFINTAYNVHVEFPLASIGKRLLAWVIDVFIRILYVVVVGGIVDAFNLSVNVDLALDMLLVSLPLLTYYLWQELLFNGRTVGKMALNIRVISLEGYKPTPAQIMNRWLFRLFDTAIFTGVLLGFMLQGYTWVLLFFALNIVSLVLLLRSDKTQRLGDIVANTIVVDIKQQTALTDTLYVELDKGYEPKYPQVTKLNDRDISIIKDMLKGFYNTGNVNIIHMSYHKVVNALGVTPTENAPEQFFERVVADYNYYTTKE